MKKIFTGLTIGVATLLLGVFMTACSSFSGTYKFYSVTRELNGEMVTYIVGDDYYGEILNDDLCILSVNSDGKWSMEMKLMGNNGTFSGAWEKRDGKYYLSAGISEEYEVTVDGNKVTFEMDGDRITLQK